MTDTESSSETAVTESLDDHESRERSPGGPLAVDPTTEVSVPAGSETYDCPHCGRVFPRERQRDLHRGQEHPEEVTEAEAEAFRRAAESEWDDLRRYRYLALGALVLLYFGFLIAFVVFG
ncbi:MAG: C2H2-type zinc finger protein [Halobaculum sp.]